MADEITDAIESNATGPSEANMDGRQVKQHNLKDQIEADRYLASKTAAAAGGIGIRLNKLVPPGTTA